MDSYEFNKLSTLEKLQHVVAIHQATPSTVVDTNHMTYSLAEIAEYLDEVAEVVDVDPVHGYPTRRDNIKLVQFLDEKSRGRGCKWCGG